MVALRTEDFAATIGVDPGSDSTTALTTRAVADLHRLRISGDEGEWPGITVRAMAELLDRFIEVGSHP